MNFTEKRKFAKAQRAAQDKGWAYINLAQANHALQLGAKVVELRDSVGVDYAMVTSPTKFLQEMTQNISQEMSDRAQFRLAGIQEAIDIFIENFTAKETNFARMWPTTHKANNRTVVGWLFDFAVSPADKVPEYIVTEEMVQQHELTEAEYKTLLTQLKISDYFHLPLPEKAERLLDFLDPEKALVLVNNEIAEFFPDEYNASPESVEKIATTLDRIALARVYAIDLREFNDADRQAAAIARGANDNLDYIFTLVYARNVHVFDVMHVHNTRRLDKISKIKSTE